MNLTDRPSLMRQILLLILSLGFAGTTFQLGCGVGGYDPWWEIQDVIGYRQDVMDWSNQAWSDVILYDDYVPYDYY